jgi:hypothetical protein
LHYADTVVAPCAAHHDCVAATANFHALAHWSTAFSLVVNVTPILLGIFWGAPLIARELEAGTYRLAWTQSVTRVRWIIVRLLMVTFAAVLVTALLSLAVTWWQSPVDRLGQDPFRAFDVRDLVPVAYTAFGVVLGALLGALLRRTLAAMAATLVCFVAVRVAIGQYVRPTLFPPLTEKLPFRAPPFNGPSSLIRPPNPADWVLSDDVVSSTGKVIGHYGGIGPHGTFDFSVAVNGTARFVGVGRCQNRIPIPAGGFHQHPTPAQAHAAQVAIQRCVDTFHLHEVLTYQPTSRYWPLQWSEVGIFLMLVAVLGATCVWWVRRRLP